MAWSGEPIPAMLAVEEEPFPVEAVDVLPAVREAEEQGRPGEVSEWVERARRWSITDDMAAEWAMRRRAEALQELDDVRAKALEWRARIDQWERESLAGPDGRVRFFTAHLEDYGLRRREETGEKVKSVKLPSGVVRTTGQAARVEVTDEGAFVTWAKLHAPDLVRTKEEAKASAFGDVLIPSKRAVGVRRTYHLACEHVRVLVETADEEADPWLAVACVECPADPIDGTPPEVEVASWDAEILYEQVVVFGQEATVVPGVGVRPAGATAKVVQ